MYLVLTAMLALNVAKDILNGFTMVDDSLHSSMEASYNRNEQLYTAFKLAHDDNPEKTQEMFDNAQRLHRQADSLYNFIQDFKIGIVVLADGQKEVNARLASDENGDPTRDIQSKDNNNVPSQYAFVDPVRDDGMPDCRAAANNGELLKMRISSFRDFLCELVREHNPELESEYRKIFSTDDVYSNTDKRYVTWESALFEDMPVCASVTILTKIQNDIRASEGQMVEYLMQQTDAADLRVNKFEAHVIPVTSDYVLRGAHYQARIVLAAVDSTKRPDFFVEGQKLEGDGLYDVVATNPGPKTISGYLTFLDNAGNPIEVPFEHNYTVGEPSASVSNMELNAIYADYDNKYHISVPGIAPDKIRVNVEGGKITKNDNRGHIEVRTSLEPGKIVKIVVMADVDGSGKMVAMGKEEYTVRKLKAPQGYIKLANGTLRRGSVTSASLVASGTEVAASYGPDELLKLDFDIVSFQTKVNGKVLDSNGRKFSNDQLNQIKKLKKGTLLLFQAVKYRPKNGGKENYVENFAIEI